MIAENRARQLALFGQEEPRCDESFGAIQRVLLGDGAWVDVARGWLSGHERLFEILRRECDWRAEERTMYEKLVEVPRLLAAAATSTGARPVIERMQRALSARYETAFERISLALYRDGQDSVAWHGDYVARRLPEALVATVSVGAPRRFSLRPTGGGRSWGMSIGWGDLLVMGGTCQRTYQHCIPKVARAGPRIAIMFRPIWED